MADIKVFWGFNSDELKEGSKGHFANTLFELQELNRNNSPIHTLEKAENGMFKAVDSPVLYNFFGLVEEPKEEKTDLQRVTEELAEEYPSLNNEEVEDVAKTLLEKDVVIITEDSVTLPDMDSFSSFEEYAEEYFSNNFENYGDVKDYIDMDGWGRHLWEESEGYADTFTDSEDTIWGIK